MAHMIANPTTLTNLQSEWAGVVKMRERMKLLVVATFAGGAITAPALSKVLYNLPMLLAFDVFKSVLQAARDEGIVVWPPGKLMDSAKTALTWNDWGELDAGVRRRNEIAHDGKLFDSSECLKDIANVQEQLVAWAIIDAA
ncbi:MAG: hypothetical protein IH899_15445 [Planctomycetes bacterium]|nr:hypothetical protein [Planctomycetota bacterium]